MKSINRLYKLDNYTIQKTISLEDTPYMKLKYLINNAYDATISEIINVCIEEMLENGNIQYSPKPQGEIAIYRSIMVRKKNIEALTEINRRTGISITRLINIAIKRFLENYAK